MTKTKRKRRTRPKKAQRTSLPARKVVTPLKKSLKQIYTENDTSDPTAELRRTKTDKYIELLYDPEMSKLPKNKLAMMAGFSESTANTRIYSIEKEEWFQLRVQEYAKRHNLVENVPIALRILSKILNEIEANTDQYPKKKDVVKQALQIGGVLGQDEEKPTQTTVNIEEMKVLIKQDV